MNIFEGFCLLSWNAFNLHWTIIFELKSRFFPLQMYPSQNVNKISKLTIVELNLWSYVYFEQVNGWSVVIQKSSQFWFLSVETTYMYVMLTRQIFFPDINLKSHRIINGRLISPMTAIWISTDFSPSMYAFFLL